MVAKQNKLTSAQHNKLVKARELKKQLRENRKKQQADQAYRQHINTIVSSFMILLKLHQWEVKLQYDGDYKAEDVDIDVENDYAGVVVQDDYLLATIYFTKQTRELFTKCDWRELARVIAHELCHIFMQPFLDISANSMNPTQQNAMRIANERQTSYLSHVILDMTPHVIYEPM